MNIYRPTQSNSDNKAVSIFTQTDSKDHLPNGGVTVRCDPHPSKVISIDFILYELAPALLVHIDASCLAVVNFTAHHCGVSIRFYLKTCNSISVDVAALKVAL